MKILNTYFYFATNSTCAFLKELSSFLYPVISKELKVSDKDLLSFSDKLLDIVFPVKRNFSS